MTIEDRLVDIETKIAFQEDTVDELNKVIYQQQQKLERLEAICASLVNHIQDLRESAAETQAAAANEKPPHY
jgi:SlyX protein